MPGEFLFQNGIGLCGMTWVSKFFVTQSRFVKVRVRCQKCELGENVSLFIAITICFMRNESILKNSYQH